MLYSNLKLLREQRRFTRMKMAREIGVSFFTYNRIESGKSFPSMEHLEKICKVLECKIANLIR